MLRSRTPDDFAAGDCERRSTRRRFVGVVVGLLTASELLLSASAAADRYPARLIKLVTGGAPGSVTDNLARPLAERLATSLGQPVIVDNRPGAGGILAMKVVSNATPDGYVLGIATTAQLVTNQFLFDKLPYDASRDVVPVIRLASTPMIVAANASFPVSTFGDLIRLAMSQPGRIAYSVPQLGSSPHLLMMRICHGLGIDMRVIPYRSAVEAVKGVIAGDVPIIVDAPVIIAPYVQAGALKPLVATFKAVSVLSDVPTMEDLGLGDYVQQTWIGLVAPTGVPDQVVHELANAVVEAMQTPELKRTYEAQGWRIIVNSPEEFRSVLERDRTTWAAIIGTWGFKLDR